MKLNNCIIYLLLIFNSCVSDDVKVKRWVENTMQVYEEELKHSTCNIIVLNVTATSEVVSYFIWKKYGVLVEGYIGDMTREDSCYYETMKQIIIEKKGQDTVNTIIEETEKLMQKPPIIKLEYFDGVYGHLLNASPINGKGAKIIDEENYYKILDSLGRSIKENMNEGFLSFWVTVDTIGRIEQVELINQECEGNIYEGIVHSLKTIKWHPAIFNNFPVKYRFRETIFIKKKGSVSNHHFLSKTLPVSLIK